MLHRVLLHATMFLDGTCVCEEVSRALSHFFLSLALISNHPLLISQAFSKADKNRDLKITFAEYQEYCQTNPEVEHPVIYEDVLAFA